MSDTCGSCGAMLMPSSAGRGWRFCPNKTCKTNQPSEPHVVSPPVDDRRELAQAVKTLRASIARWRDPRGETVTVDAHAVKVVLDALEKKP